MDLFTFSRLFNNMENNIVLSETVLSQTVLNASPSDIMLCWRIYNSNNHFLCSKNARLCSKPPSILASGAFLFLNYSLPLPFLVTGSLLCNYFSPDQSQRQKHFCNFLKSSQRTTFPLIPSILFCCFNQLRTSAKSNPNKGNHTSEFKSRWQDYITLFPPYFYNKCIPHILLRENRTVFSSPF